MLKGVQLVIPFIAQPPTAQGEAECHKSVTAQAGDCLELSTAGITLAEIHEDPDMRIEKVARIRSEIQNGLYDEKGKLEAVIERVLDDVLA